MERIFHPEDLEVTWAAVIVLVLSILVKVYMGYFNRRLGRKFRSETMLMAGRDALNDTVSTGWPCCAWCCTGSAAGIWMPMPAWW